MTINYPAPRGGVSKLKLKYAASGGVLDPRLRNKRALEWQKMSASDKKMRAV